MSYDDGEYLREVEWYIDEFYKIAESYNKKIIKENNDDEIVLRLPKQELSLMPTYEFKCKDCGNNFTELCSPSKMPNKCPKCEGKIAQVYSTPNIVFKQGAFYRKG